MASKTTGTISVDGNTSLGILRGDSASNRPCALQLSSSFGGGTITLQASHDGSTWSPVMHWTGSAWAAVTFTAAGVYGFDLPAGMSARLVMAGATDPTVAYAVARDD